MENTRRDMLEKALFGAGYAGLRALATGLPLAAFTRPLSALAQEMTTCTAADKANAKFLILSTSASGDPMNANVPGTYAFPDMAHALDPGMARTDFKLGNQAVTAAQLWSTLPQWALDRTSFFHHATLTNNHANLPKVMKVMGMTARQEMMPSIFARHLAPCLGTVQTEPVSVGAGEILTYNGRGLPNVPPTGLRDVLTRPKGTLATLQQLRDQTVDKIYGALKENGTPAQRAYLDSLAMSRRQARSLSDDLLGMLAGITTDTSAGQVLAAVALVRMNVAPVIAIRIDFGGDNHTDPDLMKSEVPAHATAMVRITALMEAVRQYGLEDKVVFAAQNVFGRTLKKLGTTGRDHWASHHVTVMMGKTIRPGVIGGLEPKSGDYYATPIDSVSGRGTPGGGDIPFGETLASVAKTLGRAVGLPKALLDTQISGGKPVAAALTV